MIIINEETDFIYKYKLKDKHLRKLESFFYSTQSQRHPTTHLSSIFVLNLFFP